MTEGMVVPASAIPAKAWGISGRALAEAEIAAADPFGGNGVRLDIPEGLAVSIADVQEATGMSHVVLFGSGVAWVEREPGVGGIAFAWQSWLARHGRGDESS